MSPTPPTVPCRIRVRLTVAIWAKHAKVIDTVIVFNTVAVVDLNCQCVSAGVKLTHPAG